mmetsp:Transcript_49516/g.56815  ORF Transcript_49516/g.56815 Transcript_49516/m.56815 type:complete len:89 (-) Transcript_49516:7-273(-)
MQLVTRNKLRLWNLAPPFADDFFDSFVDDTLEKHDLILVQLRGFRVSEIQFEMELARVTIIQPGVSMRLINVTKYTKAETNPITDYVI